MKYFISILSIVILSTTVFSQNYSFKEIPQWVEILDIPKESDISKYDIASGYYLTLADYQINLDEKASYTREVINVLSYNGITNASQLSVAFDTSYQNLVIHHLHIYRKGKKIDRTSDLSPEQINNELSLHQGIYTGTITVYDILNDIRKDDLIDFAYTLYGENPIFENEKYLYVPLETMNPIDHYSVKILHDANKSYIQNCVNCDSINISDSIKNDIKTITIDQKNTFALELETGTPSWVIPYPYFTISSLPTWTDVNKWAQKVFDLEKKPNLDEVFEEVFDGTETTYEKVNKLINFVQDDIRYMGIESGIGSIKPFSPEQVIKQRFGDCKDKSLLLVSLLKQIGVNKAYPVLVNTILKYDVDKLKPSNQVFNHCIVRFDYNDTCYWIDPTIAQQGGDFKNIFTYDYGKALVVGLENDSIFNMNPNQNNSKVEVFEEYTITSFTEPSTLKITSKRYGIDADQRRSRLEYSSTKDLVDQLTNELQHLFPTVKKTKPMEINDDINNNILTLDYYFELDNYWINGDLSDNPASKGYWTFNFEPLFLYQYISKTICENRENDFQIIYPLNLTYTVLFNFPKEILINDDVIINENESFYFKEQYEQFDSKTVQVTYSFKTKSNVIKAASYTDICNQKNDIVKTLPLLLYFNK